MKAELTGSTVPRKLIPPLTRPFFSSTHCLLAHHWSLRHTERTPYGCSCSCPVSQRLTYIKLAIRAAHVSFSLLLVPKAAQSISVTRGSWRGGF